MAALAGWEGQKIRFSRVQCAILLVAGLALGAYVLGSLLLARLPPLTVSRACRCTQRCCRVPQTACPSACCQRQPLSRPLAPTGCCAVLAAPAATFHHCRH